MYLQRMSNHPANRQQFRVVGRSGTHKKTTADSELRINLDDLGLRGLPRRECAAFLGSSIVLRYSITLL